MIEKNSNIQQKGNAYQRIRKLNLQFGKHLDDFIKFYERVKDTVVTIPAVCMLQFRSRHSSAPEPYRKKRVPSTSTRCVSDR